MNTIRKRAGLAALVPMAVLLASSAASAESSYPLFKAFPELEARMPRVELVKGATPLEPLDGLEASLGATHPSLHGRLWIKRDDRSDEPLGGNKARKLEFLFADARLGGAHTLVTAGNYGSNHAYTTALAGRELGFKVRLILGPQPVTPNVREKLLALHALGADLRYHGNKLGMGLDMLQYMVGQCHWKRNGIYYIPPGGSDEVGSAGYVNAFFELLEQTGTGNLPAEIVVPVGSGGTTAGLLAGACLSGQWEKVSIHAVAVVDPLLYNERKLRKDSEKLYDSIVAKLDEETRKRVPRCDFRKSGKALVWVKGYYEPEYGAATPEVHEAIARLKATDGITLDVTYSGKAMRYYLDRVTAGKSEGRTLFWHTYNSFPLSQLIEKNHWSDPARPWLDLPKPFQKLFR